MLRKSRGDCNFAISGGCNWDEEHGLNILFHKDRIISFGEIDGGSTYEAEKDNGTLNTDSNRHLQRNRPQRYSPHPKYNKLKCCFKNNQLLEYLLSKKAAIRYALHQCVGYGNNPEAIEILLQHGADINTQDKGGNTALFEIVNSLERHYRSNNYYLRTGQPDLIPKNDQEKFESLKALVKSLIKRGADPYIKNAYRHSCFDIMRNSDEKSRNDLHEFLNNCLRQK